MGSSPATTASKGPVNEVGTKAFNRKALVEAIFVVAFGLVAVTEALRLIIYKDPYTLYDPIGPGFYVLALGVGLLIVGIGHFAANWQEDCMVRCAALTSGETRQLLSAIIVLLLYIVLMNITGYFVATLVFFLLDMRVSGVKSWRINVVFAVLLTALYYAIFVRVCEMEFPRGIFF